MPRPLALLFDLDGTLVDSIDLLLAAFRHAFVAEFGSAPPDEEWIATIGTPLPVQIRGFTSDQEAALRITSSYRSFQREHHDHLLREFEGTREVLATLRSLGHPIAVVTSKATEPANRALRSTGLDHLIELVVGSDSCTRHKPDPEPVHVALRGLGYQPRDAVFVGDSPYDILSGNAAHVTSIAALWGPFSRDVLERASPNYFIAHIHDLVPLILYLEAAAHVAPTSAAPTRLPCGSPSPIRGSNLFAD